MEGATILQRMAVEERVLPSDSQSQGRHERRPDGENERVNVSAKQFADKADKAQMQQWPADGQVRSAFVACAADPWAFETLTDASGGAPPNGWCREKIACYAFQVRLNRRETPTPKRAKPHFPQVCVEEALAQRPTLYNVGPLLIPSQQAVNSPLLSRLMTRHQLSPQKAPTPKRARP